MTKRTGAGQLEREKKIREKSKNIWVEAKSNSKVEYYLNISGDEHL